jgi:type II secretory pathway predicted ATPase ExeA
MTPVELPGPLVESREAAAARLAYAVQRPGGLAVLCGPPGTGVSTVLSLLTTTAHGGSCQPVVRPLRDWHDDAVNASLPDIVLADDAHACDGTMIHRLLDRCRRRRPAASLVLAGHGRLLSLIARDANLERAVLLRAVLRPFSFAESQRVLDTVLARPGTTRPDDAVVHIIHELAAGIPTTVARLAELAGVVAASRPDGNLSARDVEAIHRRLCLRAA